jgi:hypothetical protein
MLREAKHAIAYTGAGLSRASGIADYATKAKDSVMKSITVLKSPLDAQPSYSHYVLTSLHRHGLLHSYVQQNRMSFFDAVSFLCRPPTHTLSHTHIKLTCFVRVLLVDDGLPQKSGFPQSRMNGRC